MPLSSTLYGLYMIPFLDHDKSRKSDPDPHRKECGFEVLLNSVTIFLVYKRAYKAVKSVTCW
jgi:hypothetical protein